MSLVARYLEEAGLPTVIVGSARDVVEHCGVPRFVFTDNVAWDKESTHTRDRGSYLPVEVAAELAAQGRFAGLTRRFHGVPTEYSQRKTLDEDAPEVLRRLRQDGADGAILSAL